MSRFFELLTETARLDQKPDGQDTVPDNRGGAASRDGAPVTVADMEEALSSMPVALKPAVARMEQSFVSPEGLKASHTEVKLDRRARLIPQAIDRAIMEHYRRLRTRVLQQQQIKPFRTLLVTSPSPQEGKTLTVLNLGLSFAMLPSVKVLIVDGDLRRSSFGRILGVHDRPGFSNLIEGSAQLEEVVLESENFPLHFVLSGTSSISPGELLQSNDVRTQLRRMSEAFSLVLVDSPPLNLLTDAQLLATSCDAVLLVARAFRSKRKFLEKAAQELSQFNVIGTVLTGGAPPELCASYDGYY